VTGGKPEPLGLLLAAARANRRAIRRRAPARTALSRGAGAPLRWDDRRYARLLTLYAEALMVQRWDRHHALRVLAAIEGIGERKVEERIRLGRNALRSCPRVLPAWAREILHPRFQLVKK